MAGDIYRYPLNSDGEIERFLTTSYEHHTPTQGGVPASGVLEYFLIEGEWLIALDTEVNVIVTPFKFRAVNLRDGTEKILDWSDEAASFSLFAAEDGKVAWLREYYYEDSECEWESAIIVYDLETDQRIEMDRACATDNYKWFVRMDVDISESYVTAVKQYSDAKGGAQEIHLIDIDSGVAQILSASDKRRKFGPEVSRNWVAWKNYPEETEIGLEYFPSAIIQNLETGEQREIKLDGDLYGLDEPIIFDGRWLYWDYLNQETPWKPVYDLNTWEEYRLVLQGSNELLDDFRIRADTVVWSVRTRTYRADEQPDIYLRWRTGAPPEVLLTQE